MFHLFRMVMFPLTYFSWLGNSGSRWAWFCWIFMAEETVLHFVGSCMMLMVAIDFRLQKCFSEENCFEEVWGGGFYARHVPQGKATIWKSIRYTRNQPLYVSIISCWCSFPDERTQQWIEVSSWHEAWGNWSFKPQYHLCCYSQEGAYELEDNSAYGFYQISW